MCRLLHYIKINTYYKSKFKTMKTMKIALTLILIITSSVLFAQKSIINTEKSSIDWVGKKIGGQHNGEIKIKNGSLELKNDQIIAGNFTIDMNSITCKDLKDDVYNQKLVGHLKSDDFFGVAKFPTATLKVTSATKFINDSAAITGEITIKGKTESITFDLIRNNKMYTAKIDVDRSKFNVKYGSTSFFDSLGDKAIDDIFNLNVKLMVN